MTNVHEEDLDEGSSLIAKSFSELLSGQVTNDCTLELKTPSDVIKIEQNTQIRVRLEWYGINVGIIPRPPTCAEKLRRCFHSNREIDGGNAQPIPILKNVSGVAESGSLLAIMGASGSGKTTMLNVLSDANLSGLTFQGSVLVNNKDIGGKIRRISAYVQQEDLFVGTLTVKEHLTFQALLRMGSNFSRQEKMKRVKDLISELGLSKCQDTLIGVAKRIPGISGGELKRLAFASEIITNPNILFVDEPTSGLDSFMAEAAVLALQQLAKEGRTILATIHQPSSEVFQLFDRLLILSGGRTAFSGTTKDADRFFSEVGYPCPSNFNSADHYIHTVAIKAGQEEEDKAKSNIICDAYENGKYGHKKGSCEYSEEDMAEIDTKQIYQADICTQYRSLVWKFSKAFRREPFLNTAKIMQAIAIAIVSGLAFFQQKNDQDGIRNINGALFFVVINLTFSNSSSVLFLFPAERPIMMKENRLGMYRLIVAFLARALAQLPWVAIQTLIFSTIFYWMAGLRTDVGSFLIFVGVCQLLVQCSVSYGLLLSAIAPTVQVALAINAPLVSPFILFGGFFIKDSSVPLVFIWLKFLSWIKYSFEALEVNQWDGFGKIQCKRNTTACLANGGAVLQMMGYEKVNFNHNIAALFCLTIGFRLLAFLCILIRSHRAK